MKSKKSALKQKLDSYVELSDGNRAAAPASQQNWMLYAAAAGSSLAMSTAAEAAIIHGTVNQTQSIAGLSHNGSNQPGSAAQVVFPIDGVNATVDIQAYLTGGFFANGDVELKGSNLAFSMSGRLTDPAEVLRENSCQATTYPPARVPFAAEERSTLSIRVNIAVNLSQAIPRLPAST